MVERSGSKPSVIASTLNPPLSLQGGFPDPLALSQNGSDQTLDPPKPPWELTTT